MGILDHLNLEIQSNKMVLFSPFSLKRVRRVFLFLCLSDICRSHEKLKIVKASRNRNFSSLNFAPEFFHGESLFNDKDETRVLLSVIF